MDDMDVTTFWWIIGGLTTGISTLMGMLYRSIKYELDDVKTLLQSDLKLREDFATFRGMDKTREEHWDRWRQDIERRISEHINGQSIWRHNELGPSLKRIEADLATIKETVRHLEIGIGK